MKWTAHSTEEMIKLGSEWAKKLPPGALICLFGDLGAGKTTFVKGVAEGLGLDKNRVSSPTFVYMNIYEGETTLIHFDLYRLKDLDQFLSMGFDEYLDSPAIKCIEWSEKIEEILPKESFSVRIKHIENGREIEVRSP